MGTLHDPIPAKPICAILWSPEASMTDLRKDLESLLGTVESESAVFLFDYTDYYHREMGTDLQKQYLSFKTLMHPEDLPGLKMKTNVLESQWSEQNKRRINLDPGYITAAKLVLASTKDFAHRVYLGDQIYGDVQLRFMRGKFHFSEWTYPDYQTELAQKYFSTVRERFNEQDKTI
ncbi:DUF4416 family protein [candidate division KSB1 bacterium]|nr:DUF4416 family protein [candidate division KSB1 bacterium]